MSILRWSPAVTASSNASPTSAFPGSPSIKQKYMLVKYFFNSNGESQRAYVYVAQPQLQPTFELILNCGPPL